MNAGNVWVALRIKDKATKDFNRILGGFSKKIALAFGAFKILKTGIKEVSDLAEAYDSLNRLIGEDGVKAIKKFSDSASASAGLSRANAATIANNFAGLFSSIPEGAINSGQAIADLEQRTADLGSQFNKSNESIFSGLQSALAGRVSLTLQQMGIDLSATAMETRLAAGEFANLGYAAGTSLESLTAGEKVLLRYNTFMDVSKKSSGNFAQTLGISFPNQLKKMKASFYNAAASITKGFMPTIMTLLKLLTKLGEFVERNAVLIKVFAGVIAGIKIAGFIKKMITLISSFVALAAAKAGAEGGIAGVFTAAAVATGIAGVLGGIAGGMFFNGSGSGGSSAPQTLTQEKRGNVYLNFETTDGNLESRRINGGFTQGNDNFGAGRS